MFELCGHLKNAPSQQQQSKFKTIIVSGTQKKIIKNINLKIKVRMQVYTSAASPSMSPKTSTSTTRTHTPIPNVLIFKLICI